MYDLLVSSFKQCASLGGDGHLGKSIKRRRERVVVLQYRNHNEDDMTVNPKKKNGRSEQNALQPSIN